LIDASMMLVPVPRAPKFWLATPCTPSRPMPDSTCHCTPSSAARSAVSSTISASTNTCARRMSSFSITARRLL
jgi:hypothetical protein